MKPLALPSVSLEHALKMGGTILILVVFLFYALFQARNFIQGPHITLDTDIPHQSPERTSTISGTAENVVLLTLNGKEIHTDTEGHFSHTLVLERGYTLMTLEAHDRFGRRTTLTRGIVFAPPSDSGDLSLN